MLNLMEKIKKFFSTYKHIILIIFLIFIGVLGFKIFYDYQQEQKEIIYKTVDETNYYSCGSHMFGLNQSPQDRDFETYSRTSFVLYRPSDVGRNEPYIFEVETWVETDYLYFWAYSTRSSYARGSLERPVFKLNRVTGKLHALKPNSTYTCGLSDFCRDYTLKREEDYEILDCRRITENDFDKEFSRRLKAYKQERKF